ncbi:hypothetical protein BgiBS90_018920, partial [Biomphalaria glabrata]
QSILSFELASEDVLRCEASWYPKNITIKNEFTGQVLLTTRDNGNTVRESKIAFRYFTYISNKCENSGLYTCSITDFQNKYYQKMFVKRTEECPVKFCDNSNTTVLQTTINKTVNFSLCLFFNEDIDIGVPKTSLENVRYIKEERLTRNSYLLLHFRIYEVDDTFAGNHTIVISTFNKRTYKRQNLNRTLTIVTY